MGNYTGVAIALGILYAAFKFVPNPQVKAGAVAVAAVIVAKKLPYIQDQLA
jgi:hypothetical protein